MKIRIVGGTVVNEGRSFKADIVTNNDRIAEIIEDTKTPRGSYNQEVDATGCFVLPGVIDEHVHFREPGLTRKADIESESRAAAYGGVTSYFEMPNTVPQTTTPEALASKFALASRKSHVNYSFFFGATNDNAPLFKQLDCHSIPGIKLFMGASTGNMLVDKTDSLALVFRTAARLGLPVMTHCEDTALINRNMSEAKERFGDDPPITLHPLIRSAQACYNSSSLAVRLARENGTRLHIAHVSTAAELELITANAPAEALPQITMEATPAHLFFSEADYHDLGARIKCNPAVKTDADRAALRKALADGRIACIGTDHAPHELADKQGGCAKAASGMPMVQFALPLMLELVDRKVLSIERLVELMSHNPARLFGVNGRGYLRKGCKADIVIVKPHSPWTVTEQTIQSKCKWSPLLGHRFSWQIRQTLCNGRLIYNLGQFDESSRGEAINFR